MNVYVFNLSQVRFNKIRVLCEDNDIMTFTQFARPLAKLVESITETPEGCVHVVVHRDPDTDQRTYRFIATTGPAAGPIVLFDHNENVDDARLSRPTNQVAFTSDFARRKHADLCQLIDLLNKVINNTKALRLFDSQ